MSLASNLWKQLRGAPDGRSDGEVSGDIDAELAFHLEQRERELVAGGLAPEAARAEALARFGNIDEVRAECRRVQLGGRIMLQRVTLVILVILVATVAWLSFQSVTSQRAAQAQIESLRSEISGLMQAMKKETGTSPGAVDPTRVNEASNSLAEVQGAISRGQGALGNFLADRNFVLSYRSQPNVPTEESTTEDAWLERFQSDAAKKSSSEDHVRALGQHCSEPRVYEVVKAIWPKVGAEQRLALLDGLVDKQGEGLAQLLVHLGATDSDDRVATRAFTLLRELVFVRFDIDHRADYLAWHTANKELAFSEIVEKSAPALVKELLSFSTWNETCALYSPPMVHRSLPLASVAADAMRDAGALELVQRWAHSSVPRARVAAVQWMAAIKLDEVTARMIVMPLLADQAPRDPGLLPSVCTALVDLECTWRWEPMLSELKGLMRTKQPDPAQLEAVATALSGVEAEKVLPTIVAWLALVKSPSVNEILGRAALVNLSGVEYDASHDGDWWVNWWSIHRAEYPNAPGSETGLPLVSFF